MGKKKRDFGWLVTKEAEEKRFLLMVGYAPNMMPKRGSDGFVDLALPDVIEKACWNYALNGFNPGVMHKAGGEEAFVVVENYIYRNPEPWVMKAANGDTVTIPFGTWVLGLILSKEEWDNYKAGKYNGGSMQGRARRRYASPEALAQVRS